MQDQPLAVATRKDQQATQPRELPIVRRVLVAGLLTTLWLVPLLSVNAWVGAKVSRQHGAARASVPAQTSGPSWATSTTRTAASFFFTPPAATDSHIDPAFQAYYTAHLGASQLGQPITAAIPIHQGLVQFFVAGALLLPAAKTAGGAGDLSQQLIDDGVRDDASGIVRLPLLHALLTVGSTLPLGDDDSGLTYVDLRTASRAEAMLPDPDAVNAATTLRAEANQSVFVTEDQRAGHAIGHTIPLVIWTYLQRQDVLPDGWQTDLGLPLTEALPTTVVRADGQHRLLVQAFGHEVLVADLDTMDTTGAPVITRQPTGTDYLRTLGVPTLALSEGNQLWVLGDAAVLASPATDAALIHVGANFSLTSAGGEARWAAGALWYHVRWSVPHSTGDGWIAATATSITSPGAGAVAWASFDVLSPQLATFLASQGENVAAVVYDLTRGRYYGYHPNSQFIMASSAKVPIMLALLTMMEDQQREPNDNEMYLLTTMIENSDNDSAQALFDEIGGGPALASLMQRVGVSGMVPNGDAWGWSTISPYAMARLLALLHDGKILTAHDRGIALNLMQNIEPDERTGVGDTAPAGATVAMKDGWVPAPDGLWAMNSSGIITVGNETYIVTVYTQHENSLDDGWAITRRVCGDVGKLLA